MADALGTPPSAATPTVGVVSDEDHRIAIAGMIAPQTSSLAVRTGVLWGPGTTALVTGTSATGTMTYAIALHHAVTTRGTADGVYLGPNLEAATTVATTAAPGANSRIDIIWVKQNDTASSVSADSGSTAPLYGVANGTAAASPTAPSIPVGAIELARATVAAGATSTNGAGVTITQTARQTVARGADVPVRTQAERDAFTTFPLLTVKRLDTGRIEVRNTADTAWDYAGGAPPSIVLSTMASGWTAYGPQQPAAYKDSSGLVHLVGTALNSALYDPTDGFASRNVCTLPVGYRPGALVPFMIHTDSVTSRIVFGEISTAGVVRLTGGTGNSVPANFGHYLHDIPPFHPGYAGGALA